MILAIDQGSTKTAVALLQEDGTIRGVGLGPGACYFSVGIERARAAIEEALEQALAQADACRGDITVVMGGMAGANFPDEITMLEETLTDMFHPQKVQVQNDCVIALRAGSDAPNAMVLCVGTGLNCAVRRAGDIVRVYNNFIDDNDQGGGSLGKRALEAVYMAEIAVLPPTQLRQRALEFFGYGDVLPLRLAHQRRQLQKRVSDFVPQVFAAADAGDQVAMAVLHDFGKSLSRYVHSAANLYGLHQSGLQLVLTGGVMKARNPVLRDTIVQEGRKAVPNLMPVEARLEPLMGACVMALELAGSPAAALQHCRSQARGMGLQRI